MTFDLNGPVSALERNIDRSPKELPSTWSKVKMDVKVEDFYEKMF